MMHKLLIFLSIATISLQSARIWASDLDPAGQTGTQSPSIEQIGSWMAPHMLRCATQRHDCDAAATRAYAFLLLKMPSHSEGSLNQDRNTLSPVETALLEGAIGRMTSDQNVEYEGFLEKYIASAHSPPSLLKAHLSEIRSLTGGSIITDSQTNSTTYIKRNPAQVQIVVTISIDWLNSISLSGSYRQLADQLQLISGLCSQPRWKVVVMTSTRLDKEAMSIEAFADQRTRSTAPTLIYPNDLIFTGNPEERQLEHFK